MLSLHTIIKQHDINFHYFAHLNSTAWVTANFLLMTSDKTTFVIFGPEHVRNRLSGHLVMLDGITLTTFVDLMLISFQSLMSFLR